MGHFGEEGGGQNLNTQFFRTILLRNFLQKGSFLNFPKLLLAIIGWITYNVKAKHHLANQGHNHTLQLQDCSMHHFDKNTHVDNPAPKCKLDMADDNEFLRIHLCRYSFLAMDDTWKSIFKKINLAKNLAFENFLKSIYLYVLVVFIRVGLHLLNFSLTFTFLYIVSQYFTGKTVLTIV